MHMKPNFQKFPRSGIQILIIILRDFRTAISRLPVVSKYNIKYAWTRLFALYNLAVDNTILCNNSKSQKIF
jgi:hypothetical protein